MTELRAGVKLSGHLLTEEIGSGGFSRVFKAEPEGGGPAVAIKFAIRPELVSALKREGAALKRLEGPRFVKVLEEHLDDDPPHFVLELCKGGDLRSLLERSPEERLTPDRVLRLMFEILEGVTLMHQQGVVHGDLKPENILLGEDEQPKVADLGLSRASRQELIAKEVEVSATLLSGGGKIAGTLDYLAPEVRRGGELSPTSDVFALGVMLYEMLVGERPLGRFTPASECTPSPVWLDATIDRALSSDPRERYRDAAEMLEALKTDMARGARCLSSPTSVPLGRNPAGAWLGGVLVLFGFLLLVATVSKPRGGGVAPLAKSIEPEAPMTHLFPPSWRDPKKPEPVRARGLAWLVASAEVRRTIEARPYSLPPLKPQSRDEVFVILHASVTNETAHDDGTKDIATVMRRDVRLRDASGTVYRVEVRAESYLNLTMGVEWFLMTEYVGQGETRRFTTAFVVPEQSIDSGLSVVFGAEGEGETPGVPLARR